MGAFYVNGSPEEQAEASKSDYLMHVISFPWKFAFAFVPPTDFAGGWLCFWMSLMMIGGVTALIGDIANLVGCTMGIPAPVTAITFVALGTSLPDTFASKSAAVQDPYADASVGNVTGSNSVNVFLGLGMPWAMGAFYWTSGTPSEEWFLRYPDIAIDYPNGAFVVRAGSLTFSVFVFSCCAVTCLSGLLLRRKLFGGELGGGKISKTISSCLFFSLWVFYIAMASWKFVSEQDNK